jgi:hypothetical protein
VSTLTQVCRIAARRVVAIVPNHHVVSDRSMNQRIDQPMRTPELSVALELPVALSRNCSLPWPARGWSAGLIHQLPRIFRLFALRFEIAGRRTILIAATGDPQGRRIERVLALSAMDDDCRSLLSCLRHRTTLLGKAVSEWVGTVRETVRRAVNYSAPSPFDCMRIIPKLGA